MTQDVLISVEGRVGRIRLNRPKAIHALNTAMCLAMDEALAGWADDPQIELVIIDHAEGRGFCAGGDIRLIAQSGAGDGAEAAAFFLAEYRLNHRLFTYAKPIVAVMDGITMGGGVGISLPARYRIATENTRFAMPETGIGLFPDVGGGWYLPRLPGRIGHFLALTGHRLDGAECHALGLCTHYVPSADVEAVKAALIADPADSEGVLNRVHTTPGDAAILAYAGEIDRLFAADNVEAIRDALSAASDEFARKQLAILSSKSPLSCKVSLRLLVEGAGRASFADEMTAEYALALRVCGTHDFIEGVRALIVDKDNQPQWTPATLEAVTPSMVDDLFTPLPPVEAWSAGN
jgi:enoyl-CoA hydratase